jgi:hypothetical protein
MSLRGQLPQLGDLGVQTVAPGKIKKGRSIRIMHLRGKVKIFLSQIISKMGSSPGHLLRTGMLSKNLPSNSRIMQDFVLMHRVCVNVLNKWLKKKTEKKCLTSMIIEMDRPVR